MKRILTLSFIFMLVLSACSSVDLPGPAHPASDAVQIEVMANTSLKPWLTQAAEAFNKARFETASGKPVWVNLTFNDSGQAVVDILNGSRPVLWIPDNPVWADVLAAQKNLSYQGDCVSVAQSPLVIAVWQPIAEALGWPGRELGWLDMGSLAADSTAWAYYSGGQFGDALRLGHTHPGLSATGAYTLLAIVQAAQSKSDSVSLSDIQQPMVQASVGAFEGAVSWFSSNTAELGEAMQTRGASFLGAAVMYESDVFTLDGVVPIYPFEGTFMATHAACVNKSADVLAQESALIFRNYLADMEAQTFAAQHGLRPVNASVPTPAFDPALGFDPTQPSIQFASPSVEAVYAIQDVWQAARKPVNLVMILDTSGSMRGSKIESLQAAAAQFMDQMSENDYISIIVYEDVPVLVLDHVHVGEKRNEARQIIAALRAQGDTPLYDSIAIAADAINRTTSSQATNVMVVLSDGKDTNSREYERLTTGLVDYAMGHSTTIFTIAYGADADVSLLTGLASDANGNFYLGDEASIAAIYEAMSAAFGGSVGIGR
ncbi:MAG: VWA domain-containing protein [Anaerolineales bacterium]|nr:VWA domain-containing protein [Anaerolineales bacterium]